MFPRSIKAEFGYYKYKKSKPAGCAFCSLTESSSQVIETHSTMHILKNLFPYARWDGRKVLDHLMVVPIDHVTSLLQLDEPSTHELLTLVSRYEDDGYSFYLRSPHNKSRSVPHVHGHLIKLR